tara:strand:- start:655 stop:1122 length:468 start_codon:yes stop_codon:yes gene_type:complete
MRNFKRSLLKNISQVAIFLTLILISKNSYAELKAPQFETGIRPGFDLSIINYEGNATDNDAFEDPTGIAFSNDGKKVFVVNRTVDLAGGKQQECLRTFNLSTPFDLTTAGIVQDDGDPLENLAGQTNNDRKCEDINFNNDGTNVSFKFERRTIPI